MLTNMGTAALSTPSGSAIPAATAATYRGLIHDISAEHGVDPSLTEAVIAVESAFDPNAVSSKGALGLMQLIRETGERFGVSNFFDPADNIRGGVRFLRFLIDKFGGDTDLVLAAYNSGENRVERLGRVPAIPETIAYVGRVRRVWKRLRGTPPTDPIPLPGGGDRTVSAHSSIYRVIGADGVPRLSNVGATQ